MTAESNETDVVAEAPASRSGRLPLIILSALLGVVILAGVIGGVVSHQNTKALRAELLAVKSEIKTLKDASQPRDTSPALDMALKEMKGEVEALSGQIKALTASVAAHSAPEEPNAKSAGGETSAQSLQGKAKSPEPNGHVKAEAAPEKKPDVRNCNLLGKSPEEQAAILKRCVSLIDPPGEQRAP